MKKRQAEDTDRKYRVLRSFNYELSEIENEITNSIQKISELTYSFIDIQELIKQWNSNCIYVKSK